MTILSFSLMCNCEHYRVNIIEHSFNKSRTLRHYAMDLKTSAPEPWGVAYHCLEVLENVEYLTRMTGAMTVEQRLYLDVMRGELMRLRVALDKIHAREGGSSQTTG